MPNVSPRTTDMYSVYEATNTYARPPISAACADIGSCSSEKPPSSSNIAPRTTRRSGSVTSTTWRPSSKFAATSAYSLPLNASVSDARAPPSALYRAAVEQRLPSCPRSAGAGLAGLVMSITWNPSSSHDDTSAYVLEFWTNISTLDAPPSIENLFLLLPGSSATDDTARGLAGSVTLIICTPSSSDAATTAYALPPTCAIATPSAPASLSNVRPWPSERPSLASATTRGRVGSVTLITCTALASLAATTA